MVVAMPSLETRIAAAVGDAAIGVAGTSHWNADFDNAANRKFVTGFRDRYKRDPTPYAAQAYDAAKLIGAALQATGGKLDDTEAFRKAMLAAKAELTRGSFAFGPNQHPIQDWYEIRAEKAADGKMVLKTLGKVLEKHGDAYSKDCKL